MVSSWRAVDRPDEDRIKSSQIAQAFRSFRAERAEVARVVNHLVPSHEVFPQPSFFVGGGGSVISWAEMEEMSDGFVEISL